MKEKMCCWVNGKIIVVNVNWTGRDGEGFYDLGGFPCP